MLSDEQMDRKIREHVKAHPVILPEDYWSLRALKSYKSAERGFGKIMRILLSIQAELRPRT